MIVAFVSEARALICLACLDDDRYTVRDLAVTSCPRCASETSWPLWKWLQRKVEAIA